MANANWSNPTLTSTYTSFVSEVKNRDEDLALQFDGTSSTYTNLPTGTIRWDSSANRWKKWSGSAWDELTSTYALTGLSTTGAASIGTTLGVSGATTLATATATTPATADNSTNVATTAYVKAQGYATVASPTFTGTVTIPSGASISGYAPLASPTFTGNAVFPAGTVTANGIQVGIGTTYKPGIYSPATDQFAITTQGAERARIDSTGRLLVGASATLPVYYNNIDTWQGQFQVARSDQNAVANFSIWNSASNTYTTYGGVQLHMSACKSGTVGTHTSGALASGDTIGTINFNASDGTNFRNAARIEAVIDSGLSTADVPGRLVFSTTPDGTSVPTERMRIDNSGNVGIGCTPSYSFDVAGYIRSSAASQPQLILNSTASGSWKSNIRFQNSGTAKYEIGVDTNAAGANNFYFYDSVAAVNRAAITSTGVFQFDSGYGSAAAAYGCRAWVNFNGTTATPSTIRGSGNVSSVTKNSTGNYTVNFTTAMVDANFGATVTCNSMDNGTSVTFGSIGAYNNNSTNPATTTSLLIRAAGSGGVATPADSAFMHVAIFR